MFAIAAYPTDNGLCHNAVILGVPDSLENEVLGHLQTSLAPKDKLAKMIESLRYFYKDGGEQCFISIFSVGDINDEIAAKLKTATESWLDLLMTVFHNLGYTAPNQEAIKTLSSIQGSLVLAHITKDSSKFISCLRTLAQSWGLPSDF